MGRVVDDEGRKANGGAQASRSSILKLRQMGRAISEYRVREQSCNLWVHQCRLLMEDGAVGKACADVLNL